MHDSRLRIVVFGYLVRGPIAGMSWGSALNYLAGLEALGHEVCLLEDSGDSAWTCWDPQQGPINAEPSYGLEYATRALDAIGFGRRWAYFDAPRGRWHGPLGEQVAAICRGADLLLDVGGTSPPRPWLDEIPKRALLDLDPVFTQVANLTRPDRDGIAERFTDFFTVGENIGREGCTIPDDGLPWRPARSPVYLPAWPLAPPPADGRFTTVMQWESYPPCEYDGRRYGLKSQSLEPILDLPRHIDCTLELAIGGAPDEQLRRHGWALRDPLAVSGTPEDYQRYIRGSHAEFAVAKHGYATTWSGWFSERSASYLATGRPVVTQQTGFSEWLEAGSGVLAFSTRDEAVAAIEDVEARYSEHCAAARELAEAHFDSHIVLGRLLDSVFGASRAPPAAANG